MPYQLNRYNRTPLVVVDDGVTDQSTTSLTFVGKNFAGYGGIQNENFLYLLENFANGSQPSNPVSGQIWYDTNTKRLKFYDATLSGSDKWRTTGGSYIGATAPTTSLNQGDFWFDTEAKQLKVWNGTSYTLVGPQSVSGAYQTNLESISVKGTDETDHAVVKAVADGIVVFIISADEFTLKDAVNPIAGFSFIRQGITLVNSPSGNTTSDYRFWGTASNASKLGNVDSSNYVLKDSPSFSSSASFPDEGITIGAANDIKIWVDSGLGTIQNTVSSTISFKVKSGSDVKNPLVLNATAAVPGVTETYDIGSTTYKWNRIYGKTIYADNFIGAIAGTSTKSDTLYYARSSLAGDLKYSSATDQNTANTIVARDSSGNFSANVIDATTTRARYADLAEKYDADMDYDPGTVVVFGGTKEITLTDTEEDTRVAGVVSTNPAYLMNVESTGIAIALRGKVPCKVIGPINKGDVLVSSTIPGYAKKGNVLSPAAAIIGKSLEDKFDRDLGTIMIVVT